MPTQTQTDDRIDDTAYNPGDVHAAEVLAPKVSESEFDQIGAYANDPENASDQISDPKKLKESEEKPAGKQTYLRMAINQIPNQNLPLNLVA